MLFPASLIVVFLLWEFLPQFFEIPQYIFPSISVIINKTFILGREIAFLNTKITLIEAILGFLIGSTFGFLIGLGMAQSKIFSGVALPYVVASNAIPIVAIAPLAIIWFGSGIGSKIAVSAFLCFFPLSINTFKGLQEFPLLSEDLFKVYGASNTDFLIKYKLPNAIPYIITGLKLNAVYSVIGAVVGEFVGSDKGLGFGMLQATYNLDTAKLWGYIIIACIAGMVFYGLVSLINLIFISNKFYKN